MCSGAWKIQSHCTRGIITQKKNSVVFELGMVISEMIAKNQWSKGFRFDPLFWV